MALEKRREEKSRGLGGGGGERWQSMEGVGGYTLDPSTSEIIKYAVVLPNLSRKLAFCHCLFA